MLLEDKLNELKEQQKTMVLKYQGAIEILEALIKDQKEDKNKSKK